MGPVNLLFNPPS